jgi:hypothetical protein
MFTFRNTANNNMLGSGVYCTHSTPTKAARFWTVLVHELKIAYSGYFYLIQNEEKLLKF